MIKPKLLITALAVILFFSKASAQDSTHYDLGRIRLKKEFTQSVTVKGEDLAKMPFDNLADAINTWFYGSYTNTTNLVYIIDGNLVNDVNAYSIYDIDEITLIQNALTKIGGASQQQQLVLIKTKRPKTPGSGVTANGQASLSKIYTNNVRTVEPYGNSTTTSNSYQSGLKSTTTLYQQYYISAYKNTGSMQYGVSADFLGDGLPQIKNPSSTETKNMNRLRLNGYFDATVGHSVIDITAGYVPQTGKDVTSTFNQYNDSNGITKENDHLFNGSVKLITTIIPGLNNIIHANYNNYRSDFNGTGVIGYPGDANNDNYANKNTNYSHTIVAYDNLSYEAKFGDWNLEPEVNFSFRSFKDSTYMKNSSAIGNDVFSNFSYSFFTEKNHVFQLTPSLNIYYKNYFNIEGGVLYSITPFYYIKPTHKVFPFISAFFDVAHLIDHSSKLSVKVYGSYTVNAFISDNFSQLPDFTNQTIQEPVPYYNYIILQPFNGNSGTYYANYNSNFASYPNTYNTLSGGLTITPKPTGLAFNYFIERSSYVSLLGFNTAGFPGAQKLYLNINTNSILNRFSIDYTVNNVQFNWQTGINATMIKQNYLIFGMQKLNLGTGEWTGGWINRLTYRDFFAGIDMLYKIGEKYYSQSTAGALITNKFNSFSLQNLYVGHRLKISKLKNAEVFATGRNIFQNKKEDITDDRKYYGLGFKLSL